MKDRLFKGIVLGMQAGTITLFGILYHKLKRDHNKLKMNYNDLSSIETVVKIKDNISNVDFKKIKRQNIRKIIEDFYYRLVKDSNVDLTNFKKNLGTLKVKNIKEFEGDSSFSEALYDYYNNTIYLNIIVKPRVLAHELLHMASTIYDKNAKNVRFIGLAQDKHDKEIGMGLTEGYTELLAKRYYGDMKDISDSYVVEMDLVSSVEKIIEKEKMMKLYFKSNLQGFVNELKKYNSVENIIEFIHSIDEIFNDTINANKHLSNVEYKKHLINSVNFLIETYANKLKYEIYIELIDEEEFYKKIENFVNDLNNFDYIKCGKKYTLHLLTKKNIFKILKNVVGKDYINFSFEKKFTK